MEVRFIEFMPLEHADGIWTNDLCGPGERDPARVDEASPVESAERTSAPATRYRFADGAGTVGHRGFGQRLVLLEPATGCA